MRRLSIILCAITLFIIGGGSLLASPWVLSYQGRIQDATGKPVTDGNHKLVFRIYNVSSGGSPIWTEPASTYFEIPVKGGLFSWNLGMEVPIPNTAFTSDAWLEVVVDDQLMSPRTRLTSAPYAIHAKQADTAKYAENLLYPTDNFSGWSLNGNAGINSKMNFLGTTDEQPLVMRVNDLIALRLVYTSGSPSVIGGASTNTSALGARGVFIGGGGNNTASGAISVIGGGENNMASGATSVIDGGEDNTASGVASVIAGGEGNTASGVASVIGGGEGNAASGEASVVPGGKSNTAAGICSFAGGSHARANDAGSFVWGGFNQYDFASTAPGQFLIRAYGGVGVGINDPQTPLDVNGVIRSRHGGFEFPDGKIQTSAGWALGGNTGTNPSTNFLGTIDNQPLELRAGGFRVLRLESTSNGPNIIEGYEGNVIAPSVYGATIGGGGNAYGINQVTDIFGTVSGGTRNQAGDGAGSYVDRPYSSVGGGIGNTASGTYSVIAGGRSNIASAGSAAVGGGDSNQALGNYCAIPGGKSNVAGDYALAAGRRAQAVHPGTFVWADSTDADFASTALNQVRMRASGGMDLVVGQGGMRVEPTALTPNMINGSDSNHAVSGVVGSVIAGGGNPGAANTVAGSYCVVGGGMLNSAGTAVSAGIASTARATVGGGYWNNASGELSTIGGGYQNIASSMGATAGGGYQNCASGQFSTIPGGSMNLAAGNYSFAAGAGASALHQSSFVWNDNLGTFASTNANQFLIHAQNGVGIGTNAPQYALHVNGTVAGVGQYNALSDMRFKTNIEPIQSALDTICGLRGVTFDWRRNEFPEMNFTEGRQVGFIAQEVEKVLPEVVSIAGDGTRSVAYSSVVPVLVEAIKEQQKTIDELKAKLSEMDQLKAELDAIKASLKR